MHKLLVSLNILFRFMALIGTMYMQADTLLSAAESEALLFSSELGCLAKCILL